MVFMLFCCADVRLKRIKWKRKGEGYSKLYCTHTEVEAGVLINESFERNIVERKLKYVEKKRKSMMEVDVNKLPFVF